MATPPTARTLAERFCPHTGAPSRLGRIWPPRLILHDVAKRGESEVLAKVYMLHHLTEPMEVIVRPGDAPSHDAAGQPLSGLTVGRSARTLSSGSTWQLLPISLRWTPQLCERLRERPWVRAPVVIELKQGEQRRLFQWYAYLTGGPPRLPRPASTYDDHPHYRWIDLRGDTPDHDGVAPRWIELPAPLSSPALAPACWVQRGPEAPCIGPDRVGLVPTFPLEPAAPEGLELVGWNGALGGHDRRPLALPLGVDSTPDAEGRWWAALTYWDGPLHGPPSSRTAPFRLEPPTPCIWPRIASAGERPVELFQLREPTGSTEVLVDIRVQIPERAEPVDLSRAQIFLGDRLVGRWVGPARLQPGHATALACVLDQDAIARIGPDRLKLTVVFTGRPSRGVAKPDLTFRTDDGPWVQVHRVRLGAERPWLVLDLGTEGTCAAVAFMDGFKPRVLNISFADGPIHPSRVHVEPSQGGVWTLTDQPSENALYTSGIKLGLRFGEGAHPGCPDHVSALEVARFFLRRFLLELKERAAWFPLEQCDVLVSFPPRLMCMPRFVSAMQTALRDVLPEIVWPNGPPGRICFREEAFLVALPCLYRDLQLRPLPPERSRYYWVMDFGGGTTDLCGFLCRSDAWGEEHTLSHLTYPPRFPHHLSGNDVTAAFYRTIRRYLIAAGVVATSPAASGERRFVFPSEPLPCSRSTHAALLNQTALRELAERLKCTPAASRASLTVVDLARALRSAVIRSVDGVPTTLVSVLMEEAVALGCRSVEAIHRDVLGRGSTATASAPDTDLHRVRCSTCDREHQLPNWVLTDSKPFRFRCACGASQLVHGTGQGLPVDERPLLPSLGSGPQTLLLQQENQTYRVPDWTTVRRWVREHRVGPDDRISDTGVTWDRLGDRPELSDLFADAVPTEKEGSASPLPRLDGDDEELGLAIERFLRASQQALDDALRELPERPEEVVIVLAGRGSLFQPILDGVRATMRGRLVHLTQEWVQKHYGTTGAIDPRAGLKTLTVNGGGLFALSRQHPDLSPMALRFDTGRLSCSTYLDVGENQPRWLSRALELRPGREVERVRHAEPDEPPPLDPDQPLVGAIRLVIEGLPEDRAWEPWVTIARGTARRADGIRPRITDATRLRTSADAFLLGPLSTGEELRLESLLPRLDLLGSEP